MSEAPNGRDWKLIDNPARCTDCHQEPATSKLAGLDCIDGVCGSCRQREISKLVGNTDNILPDVEETEHILRQIFEEGQNQERRPWIP